MDNLIVSVAFIVLLVLFLRSMVGAPRIGLYSTLVKLVKLTLKITIYWPVKTIIAGVKNFVSPPFDEIHPEPQPHIKNPSHRSDRK
jgi:hypothetical protein